MMTGLELGLALLGLLMTPGPTNTLLFVGGTERGWTGALRLIPAELAGYMLTVVPLALAGGAVLAGMPALRPAIALAAGLWVAWLALGLWRPGRAPGQASVTARRVFVTTLLNPKALIFGLVLLPVPGAIAGNLAMFAAQIVVVAAIWAGLGAMMRQGSGQGTAGGAAGGSAGGHLLPLLRRAAAVWLAVVSVGLLARGLGLLA